MVRIVLMADAAPADCLAMIRRGAAIVISRPMTPVTKIMSMSAKPCALRITTCPLESGYCRARAASADSAKRNEISGLQRSPFAAA